MMTSAGAVYRDGKLELLGPAPDHAKSSRFVVTFLPPASAGRV